MSIEHTHATTGYVECQACWDEHKMKRPPDQSRPPAPDYSTCTNCEYGRYFCACAEPGVAVQMNAELETARAEIAAEQSRPAPPSVDPLIVEPFANARELYLAWANERGPWPALYGLIEAYERLQAQLDLAMSQRDLYLSELQKARKAL